MTDDDRDTPEPAPHVDERLAEIEAANRARLTDEARVVHARQLLDEHDRSHAGCRALVEDLKEQMGLEFAALRRERADEAALMRAEIARLRDELARAGVTLDGGAHVGP